VPEVQDELERGGVRFRTLSASPLTVAPWLDVHNLHRLVRVLGRLRAHDPDDPAWRPRVSLRALSRRLHTREGELTLQVLHGLPATSAVTTPLEDPRSVAACTGAFGHGSRLVAREVVVADPGFRHRVLRCQVQGAHTKDAPRRVVVKAANEGACATEAASLAFLGSLPAARGVVPHLWGADPAKAVLLLEDLGDLRESDLAMVLLGWDGARARRALVSLAEALGRVHGACVGRDLTWEALLGRGERKSFLCDELSGGLMDAPRWLRSAGVTAAVDTEVRTLSEALGEQGPWRTWTRGDAGTTNAALVQNRLRFFDLETGGFRHVMVDAAFLVAHHGALYAGSLPAGVVSAMEEAWRTAVAPDMPAAADTEQFERARAVGSLAWCAGLASRLLTACGPGQRRGGRLNRVRLLSLLGATLGVPGVGRSHPRLTKAFEDLHRRLRSRWTGVPERLPLHPAFEEGAWHTRR